VPAHHGDYYLYLGKATTQINVKPPRAFAIHRLGSDRPILQLTGIDVPETGPAINVWGNRTAATVLSLDRRFHLIPNAQVLIVIPPSNDQLILHRVDLRGAVDRTTRERK
jgi:hypothetical protein